MQELELNVADPVAGPCVARRILPDGRVIRVVQKLFTHAINISDSLTAIYIADSWCYMTWEGALAAFACWDPEKEDEPLGWHRHPPTGRRRPDGDPAREYVDP